MSTGANFSVYGISSRMLAEDSIEEVAVELRVNGYAILDSGFTPEFLDVIKDDLERVYKSQAQELGGEDELLRMKDADTARCVLSYEPRFVEVATSPALMRLATKVLGHEFVLLQQNGIINRHDRANQQAAWHRDLAYQHWTSSKTLAINALLCLDDFTFENGATLVLPGTHHIEEFPTEKFVSKFEKQIAAPAGSFLVLDAMLFHRAGINMSSRVRRAVNHVIGLPFMAQQVDIPSAFASTGAPAPKDPAIRKYLGYKWAPAVSAIDWRTRRVR
ncbi:phytanoyl-CoA dioxygenase family protein [Paraburkholderia sp. CNPSo 3272]|uniref:phytanoyl-CoA dioxygenase family protein n=1 Tax=Paraburkholderia sp. CNPSo 3272 TaxID=2940931 RepID=UPI0020B76ADC|nr:phytanoyl-CoA dioxygenase family protein [Paraburkholderia sp. CNPSo 3272]MCP3726163.1 phytanoyl-CoA dioxygenase family protein [Paraburkholderia sp. CNPSo 3272]